MQRRSKQGSFYFLFLVDDSPVVCARHELSIQGGVRSARDGTF